MCKDQDCNLVRVVRSVIAAMIDFTFYKIILHLEFTNTCYEYIIYLDRWIQDQNTVILHEDNYLNRYAIVNYIRSPIGYREY